MPGSRLRGLTLSFRGRLVLSFVFVIGATGLVATIMGAYLIDQRVVVQAQARVAQDINAARVIYQNELERIEDAVRLTAQRAGVIAALTREDRTFLSSALHQLAVDKDFDVLTVVSPTGAVVARGGEIPAGSAMTEAQVFIQRALATRTALAGTHVIGAAGLAVENPGLRELARLPLVPTPLARPTPRRELTDGMAMLAAAPVIAGDGKMLGVLYGGRLLNRRGELVDRIKDAIFRGEMYAGREVGTATLFLGDTRIATSVRDASNERALGTRIQAEVGKRVLHEGEAWTERAFVVNGWYLTAYEPIRDIEDRVIGALYIGLREDKFVAARNQTVLAFLLVTILGMALAGLIAYALARGLVRPVQALVEASQRISAGQFDHLVAEAATAELASLARAFNQMTAAIRERDRQLRERAETQIMRSANLASLGALAASVAHEVNNPITGIQIYLRMMARDFTQQPFPAHRIPEMTRWLQSMEAETARCARLISGMLQLGRQPAMRVSTHDLNAIVERSVLLLEHRFGQGQISVVRQLADDLPRVECDGEQIQQTLMGLLLNALDAMPRGGTITIATRAVPGGGAVELSVVDTGVGIAPEQLPRIFDAFYTTKGDGSGVGLGLSIAQAIVQHHDGTIEVNSEAGRGATFVVRLPVHHVERDPVLANSGVDTSD